MRDVSKTRSWRAPLEPKKVKIKGDPGKPPQPERNHEIWRKHKEGSGYIKLALMHGLSETRVRRIIRAISLGSLP